MPDDKGSKQNMVGQFFERVGHRLVGGDLTRNESDISLWKEETSVEVKASRYSSSYGFRLDLNQIEAYERMVNGFPFSRAWYVLFSYRNERTVCNGKRTTELSHCKSSKQVNNHLANTILWCVVVDISIVSRWKETRKISEKSIVGHLGTKTVDIKCKEVHGLANGQYSQEMMALGLDQQQYVVFAEQARIRVTTDFFGEYRLKFPLTAIFPKKEAEWAKKVFRRRRIYLERRNIPASKPPQAP